MKHQLFLVRPLLPLVLRRSLATVLFFVSALSFTSPTYAAASDDKQAGITLLKAQIPNGTTIRDLDCDVLAKAVSRATAAHHAEAAAILNAALMNGELTDSLRKEDRRACECVGRIVRASVKAAPAQASEVLDMAMALYPDCATAFAAVLDQSRVDEPVAGINNLGGGAEPSSSGGGAGFPGSPTFSGSSPSGGFALPTPAPTAVTSVVNQ